MHSLCNTRSCIVVYQFSGLCAVFCSVYQFYFSRSGNLHLCIFIYISICMSCNSDWFFPVFYTWLNAFYNNRCTEYCSVKYCTDRSVRTLPHFFQIILFHTCRIRCDCCTFYCNFIFLGCISSIDCYLIICLISMFQTQIIIFCVQFNIWLQKIFFDHLPENSCHLVSVHLYDRCCHFNFCHDIVSFLSVRGIFYYSSRCRFSITCNICSFASCSAFAASFALIASSISRCSSIDFSARSGASIDIVLASCTYL